MRRQKGFTLTQVSVVILLLAIFLTLTSDIIPLRMREERAIKAVQSAGMTNVQLGGVAFLGCKGEKFRRKFVAVNAQNQTVTGVVCGGWFSDDTIRYH